MRKIGKLFYYLFTLIFIFSCNEKETTQTVEIRKLDYPSASAVEYHNGTIYIMGDDATALLVLDSSLNIIDSIPLIVYPGKRIPKNIKPDFEASAISRDSLFLFGSGSMDPYRNSGRIVNLKTKDSNSLHLEPFYTKAKSLGIEQINVEGACFIKEKLILVNRGNKGYPENFLIITTDNFWLSPDIAPLSLIRFEPQKDTASFKGISGLTYSGESDRLIATVSTEDTRNVHEDGTIGKSFLWIIDSISFKLSSKLLAPDKIIDLEEIDPGFKGQKIESATIIEETKDLMRLVLVADNDDGSSTVFKMSMSKK